MNVYLDASSLLKWLLNEYHLPRFGEWKKLCSSELILNEAYRTLYRLRLNSEIDDLELVEKESKLLWFVKDMFIMQLSSEILVRGRAPLGTHVTTLDALHLASAILWREALGKEVHLLSHDDQLLNAARLQKFELL